MAASPLQEQKQVEGRLKPSLLPEGASANLPFSFSEIPFPSACLRQHRSCHLSRYLGHKTGTQVQPASFFSKSLDLEPRFHPGEEHRLSEPGIPPTAYPLSEVERLLAPFQIVQRFPPTSDPQVMARRSKETQNGVHLVSGPAMPPALGYCAAVTIM